MITKQEILRDFWEQFPQYKEMTPTYEDIRFEEEEIEDWNHHWLEIIAFRLDNKLDGFNTLEGIEEIIKLK